MPKREMVWLHHENTCHPLSISTVTPVVVIGEHEGRPRERRAAAGGFGVGLSDPHSHEGSPFPTPEECQGCCSRQGQWIKCRGWPS